MGVDDRIAPKAIFSRLISFGILLLAIVVRFYRLGEPSLWHDEAFTWWFTRMDWFEMLDTVRLDGVNPPFFYCMVKLAVTILGSSEYGLRFVSALAGSTSVLIAMQIGEIAGGKAGKYTAGMVLMLHPMAIWFSRDARPYSLALLFSLLIFLSYLKLRERDRYSLRWIGTIAIALGLLTHYFTFVFCGALILLAIIEMRTKRRFFRHWTLHSLIAFIPLGLWIYWYFSQPSPSLGIGWIESPKIIDPMVTIWNLISGFGGAFHPVTLCLGFIVGILIIAGLMNHERYLISRWVFVVGVIVPLIAVWFVSQRRPIYIDRYFIVLIPFIIYLVAIGGDQTLVRIETRITTQTTKYLSAFIFIFVIILSGVMGWLMNWHPIFQNEDWRSLVSVFQSKRIAEEPIWFSEPEASIPFQYYYRKEIEAIQGEDVPICVTSCWLIIRQPYTATHAFAQGIPQLDRPWRIDLQNSCKRLGSIWQYPGIEMLHIACE